MENILERRENMLHCARLYGKTPRQFKKNKKIIYSTNPAATMQQAAQDGKACRQNFAGLIFCFFHRLGGV
jgi:hypothetical protein